MCTAYWFWLSLWTACSLVGAAAFVPRAHQHYYGPLSPITANHRQTIQFMTTTSPRMGELTAPEQTVYDVLHALHESHYPFRVVVVGKQAGAILESTQLLGPNLSIAQSPSTGKNLLTLANDDKAFELHIQLSAVSKIVLVTKTNKPEHKTVRLVRLLNANGDSMCSLILAASEDEAVAWFNGLVDQFGSEIQL